MDLLPMTFHEQLGYWRCSFAAIKIEMNLGGNLAGPLPENTEIARHCVEQVHRLSSEASRFLAKNVGAAAAVSGQLTLEWIDVGLSDYGAHKRFEMWFSDEADYVLWSVLFHYGTNPFTKATGSSAIGFSRRSW